MENGHTQSLEAKHAGLEARITNERQRPHPDDGMLAKLKKEKLRIKEALVGLH